jgi:hypothetical protein
MIWQAQDRYGNVIYMTEERWQHALEKRPWLAGCFDDVIDTIRFGRRHQDPLNARKYKYYWSCPPLEPEYNHLVVVVLFREETKAGNQAPNNYVVNVWAVYRYDKG